MSFWRAREGGRLRSPENGPQPSAFSRPGSTARTGAMLHEWDAFRVLIVAPAPAVLFHTLLLTAPVAAEPLPSAFDLQAFRRQTDQHLDATTRAFQKAVQAFSTLAQEIAAIPDVRWREAAEQALVEALNNIAHSRENTTAAHALLSESMDALHQQVLKALDRLEACEAAKR